MVHVHLNTWHAFAGWPIADTNRIWHQILLLFITYFSHRQKIRYKLNLLEGLFSKLQERVACVLLYCASMVCSVFQLYLLQWNMVTLKKWTPRLLHTMKYSEVNMYLGLTFNDIERIHPRFRWKYITPSSAEMFKV